MKNSTLLVALLYAYLVTSQICTIYFWYLWSKDHTFLSTLIIGPIVSEIKGLLFPFFI